MMEPPTEMDAELLKKIIEGALFASGQPLTIEQLGALFDEGDRPDNATLRATLEALMQDYEGRGIELREVASGFRFQVRHETGAWVSRLWEEKASRYSRALLETLALIAYRQPITRSEIEEIRGVSVSSHIIKTLLEREWIRVAGHRDVPGRPALFATTREFLDNFSLKSLSELPSLAEIRDLERINEELAFLEAQGGGDEAAALAEFEDEDGAVGREDAVLADDEGGEAVGAGALAEVMADLEADIERGEQDHRRDDEIYE